MAQGQKLSDEKRAQIIALLLTGESIPKTARLAGVAESTVSAIKASDDFGDFGR
jgi:transposase-like protein